MSVNGERFTSGRSRVSRFKSVSSKSPVGGTLVVRPVGDALEKVLTPDLALGNVRVISYVVN